MSLPERPVHPGFIFANHMAKFAVNVCEQGLQLERHAEAVEYLAKHDSLTGVKSVFGLEDALGTYMTQHSEMALLYIDGTNIKAINDNLGHDQGDEAIKGTARILVNSTRGEDTVARIGGDEFLVVLDMTSREGARRLPGQLVGSVQARISVETQRYLEGHPEFQAQGFDIAVGHAIWNPGMSIIEVRKMAEGLMQARKAEQHKTLGAYRPPAGQ